MLLKFDIITKRRNTNTLSKAQLTPGTRGEDTTPPPPFAEFSFAKQAAAIIMIPNNSQQKGTKMTFLHQMDLKIKVLKMCFDQKLPVSGKKIATEIMNPPTLL